MIVFGSGSREMLSSTTRAIQLESKRLLRPGLLVGQKAEIDGGVYGPIGSPFADAGRHADLIARDGNLGSVAGDFAALEPHSRGLCGCRAGSLGDELHDHPDILGDDLARRLCHYLRE